MSSEVGETQPSILQSVYYVGVWTSTRTVCGDSQWAVTGRSDRVHHADHLASPENNTASPWYWQ